MAKILGLDLGTTSIGWAVVDEHDTPEQSSIVRLGVRVNPLTTDEQTNFEKGKPITTNADRTKNRSMRRNLQRYKLRRQNLVELLTQQGWITADTILSEQGNHSTFQTYQLRAKAATDQITLEEFARVLLMINKKRGYKSNRKMQNNAEGTFINNLDMARQLYDYDLTPGQYGFQLLTTGNHYVPDFYRSDLVAELDRIWAYQSPHHTAILTHEFRKTIDGQAKKGTSAAFLKQHGLYTLDIKGNRFEKNKQLFALRNDALMRPLTAQELATVVCEINGQINSSSSYLGNISDRSKLLYIKKLTVGQYLMQNLANNPNASLKNQPFYRQDYLDEFEQLWETQARFHPELTPELKHEIRDIVIFYQRRLRSQKWLVATCQFEKQRKVCPKSSPLFQQFRIWQTINNLRVTKDGEEFALDEEQKGLLYNELLYKEKLSSKEVLKLLFTRPREIDLNFATVEGNRTMAQMLKAAQEIVALSGHGEYDFAKMSSAQVVNIVKAVFGGLGYACHWLTFDANSANIEDQPQMRLWHLLYSFEGDNSVTGDEKLVDRLMSLMQLPREYARLFANIRFEDDYCSLSTKAIKKILPFLSAGHEYSEACALVGYRHSEQSLTREENEKRQLKEHMDVLPKNSLRNPTVEKILNQMVNVVNEIIDTYGRPDEVRIELARELKQNAEQRKIMSEAINRNTRETEQYRKILQSEFGLDHVSRNDIIRYRLYKELANNGYKTLYSNLFIPQEKLFSKEIEIEHIIPQKRLFDNSFSNKTLEYHSVNNEKSDSTAMDYVSSKYGAEGAQEYKTRVDNLLKNGAILQAKAKKLKMTKADIPVDFIERDLRNTQYISRKAQEMLRDIARTVTATSGSVTDRLRQDWQLVDVMQELNWDKYERQGLTSVTTGRDGQKIYRIADWTKRNDHRHHAMDALTIAFTRPEYINYLNHLNARDNDDIRSIERRFLVRDNKGHLRFVMPIAGNFRAEAKRHLEMVLVSVKAKHKVVTRNVNTTKVKGVIRKKVQLTPRGQLHKDTIYGSVLVPCTKEIAVGGKLTAQDIANIQNQTYRKAVQSRFDACGGDAKKAFTGNNSLSKTPIWLDAEHTHQVPEMVTIRWFEKRFTIRKKVDEELNIDKVLDEGVKRLLQQRLAEYGGKAKDAFANLDSNPIWLNREKGIDIKRVTIVENIPGKPLHSKHDKDGQLMLDSNGCQQPVDYVNLRNNHHVAIFCDANGILQERIVSFYEAVARRISQPSLPAIDKEYNKDKGWQYLFSMKTNEYFVFPNPAQGFDPNEIDLTDEKNYSQISPNLFRVQKISSKDYWFRHHLETTVDDKKELQNITWKRITSLDNLKGIVKVRINHIGRIVNIGEY
ncbi:MAG: type II CRISPR RNA-guided endonuclease Cas9 [Bacteroidales bacterium]|nr:type II CRISPR RNA-guided endonuclease Cas9 [Bacteroidales bacterium]